MTTPLTSDLLSELQGPQMAQIGQQLGLSQADTSGAVSAALPLLLGAMGRNAQQPGGAQSLHSALERDHAGLDIGSVLGSVLGGGGQGQQILGHVFGNRENNAAQGLSAATGLQGGQAGSLLTMLAPIVLAFLAKRSAGASPQALGSMLGQEQDDIRQQGGAAGGLLGAVLDRDGDGDTDFSDLMGLAGQFMGGGGRDQPRA